MERLIDIEELERRTNEDVPFLDSFDEPQRFPLNNKEIIIFDDWIRKNEKELLPKLPEKFKNEEWRYKVRKIRQIEREIKEEIQSERFKHSFKNCAIAFVVIFVLLFLCVFWKMINLFVFGNSSF